MIEIYDEPIILIAILSNLKISFEVKKCIAEQLYAQMLGWA